MNFWEYDWWHKNEQYKYELKNSIIGKVSEIMKKTYGWSITRKVSRILNKLKMEGISINYVSLVGHNTIRAAVMEQDYKRKPKAREISEMKEMVREAMEAGAFRLSTTLDYIPRTYADTEEIIELIKIFKEYDGIHATHWRSGYRTDWARDRVKGLIEAIEIAKKQKWVLKYPIFIQCTQFSLLHQRYFKRHRLKLP